MCCQKRSEAGAQAPAHPTPDRCLQRQRTKGMQGDEDSPVDISVSELPEGSGSTPHAPSGTGGGSSELRLPSIARIAAPRGMEGQPQAGVPPVPGRRAGGSYQEAQEAGERAAIPDREGGDFLNLGLDQRWGEAQFTTSFYLYFINMTDQNDCH